MTPIYDRAIATAKRMITNYGQPCVWREPGDATGNPANPEPGEPADHAVSIAFLNNANRESLSSILSMLGGTEVPTGGVRGLMPAVDFTPTLNGLVHRGGPGFAAPYLQLVDKNGIDVINVNGQIVLYTLRFVL